MEKEEIGSSVKEILLTRTFRHSSITVVSTAINGVLGALFYFLLARFLGSSEFGAFTILTTSIALLTGIIDLGSDQGIVKIGRASCRERV